MRSRFVVLVVLVVLVVVALLAGCSGGEESETTTTTVEETTTTAEETTTTAEPELDRTVEVSIEPTSTADGVEVAGTATVPDGALISWEIVHEESFDFDLCPVGEGGAPDPCIATGVAEVQHGAFSITATGLIPGTYEVWAAFQTLTTEDQPADVLELYGENGELIEGDVTETGGESFTMYRVETTANVTI